MWNTGLFSFCAAASDDADKARTEADDDDEGADGEARDIEGTNERHTHAHTQTDFPTLFLSPAQGLNLAGVKDDL